MSPLFKKSEEEIVAVFDIGNGSVGGALVKFSKHDHPVVLYSHREPLTFVAHASPKHLMGSMLKLLKSVAGHLAKDGLIHLKTSPFGGHRLRDAHCVFASPWYISQTKVITNENTKSQTVTKEMINELVKKEQDEFNKALKEGKYVELFGPDARLLEKKVINVKLNGYDVEDPLGKEAREVELTLFSSFMSQEIIASVEKMLHESFAVRNIHHYSYALASWSGARIMFPDIHAYFIMDISGETTDISLVVKDVFIETVSFPMGRSTLVRKIVKDLKVTAEVALSNLAMRYNGTLDKAFTEKLAEVLLPLEEEWRAAYIAAIGTFQKKFTLPRTALVTADNDTAPFFLGALTHALPTELVIPHNSLAVTFIGPDKVQPFISELPEVPPDSFLGIESIFLNELFKNN
jgi:hypothetical protein